MALNWSTDFDPKWTVFSQPRFGKTMSNTWKMLGEVTDVKIEYKTGIDPFYKEYMADIYSTNEIAVTLTKTGADYAAKHLRQLGFYTDAERIEKHLTPSYKKLWPNVTVLQSISTHRNLIAEAVMAGQTVVVITHDEHSRRTMKDDVKRVLQSKFAIVTESFGHLVVGKGKVNFCSKDQELAGLPQPFFVVVEN